MWSIIRRGVKGPLPNSTTVQRFAGKYETNRHFSVKEMGGYYATDFTAKGSVKISIEK
jgi:hypothetical protein